MAIKFTYDSPINSRSFWVAQAEIAYRGIAVGRTAKIMYLTVCLLSNTEYMRVKDYMEFLDVKVEQERLAPLRNLRKANPEAYAYVVKTDRLLPALQN